MVLEQHLKWNRVAKGATKVEYAMSAPLESRTPIFFNGKDLPLSVYWMELVSDICTEVSAETRDWLLDLQYCGGAPKRQTSTKVMVYAVETERLILKNQQKLLRELAKRLPGVASEAFVGEWLFALRVIQACAEDTEECSWVRESCVNPRAAEQMLDWLDQNPPREAE